MIIVNGYILAGKETTESFDEYGFPVVEAQTFDTKKIPCQYTLSNDYLAETKEGNTYDRKSATILIDLQPFTAERIKLYTKGGDLIKEFSIRSVSELRAVKQIQIIV